MASLSFAEKVSNQRQSLGLVVLKYHFLQLKHRHDDSVVVFDAVVHLHGFFV